MSERWPALLTTEDAAEYLGLSVKSLNRLRAAQRIKSVTVRDGSFIRFRRSDLDAFIEDLPYGNGTCAANEKRVAVVMLAKQTKNKTQQTNKPHRSKTA
jgi:excisionase family DNA binding protein